MDLDSQTHYVYISSYRYERTSPSSDEIKHELNVKHYPSQYKEVKFKTLYIRLFHYL